VSPDISAGILLDSGLMSMLEGKSNWQLITPLWREGYSIHSGDYLCLLLPEFFSGLGDGGRLRKESSLKTIIKFIVVSFKNS